MCEFCTEHGEGGRWYEAARNYSRDVFELVTSDRKLLQYMQGFERSLAQGPARAHALRSRMPRLYDLIVAPLVTRHLKKTHFGQVVPLEDIERILPGLSCIVRLPCVCRRVTTGHERRFCYGVGLDITHIYGEVPGFAGFERIDVHSALAQIRALSAEGMVHSLWTYGTPFIGALCNCDRDCMAWRFQHSMTLGQVMFKAEYVAAADPLRCTGCRQCLKRCLFDAMHYDQTAGKVMIDQQACYGCGACRVACPVDAIALSERQWAAR